MFGPLPRLHRMVVVATALAAGILSGVWLTQLIAGPALIAAGIGWGLLAGLLLDFVLLHDFQQHPRHSRVRRH